MPQQAERTAVCRLCARLLAVEILASDDATTTSKSSKIRNSRASSPDLVRDSDHGLSNRSSFNSRDLTTAALCFAAARGDVAEVADGKGYPELGVIEEGVVLRSRWRIGSAFAAFSGMFFSFTRPNKQTQVATASRRYSPLNCFRWMGV